MNPIPIVEASGDYRSVGLQIGSACRSRIEHMISDLRQSPPAGTTWDVLLRQSETYLQFSQDVYPQYITELEGIAEGSGVPFEEIFLSICEELWESAAGKGCSDLAARGRATADGTTLIAHNNDLLPSTEEDLVILKIKTAADPEFLGVSVGGVGISAGFNANGICLTGNQLHQNDIRPGVPRLLVVRAILASKRLGEALAQCLLPQRASSYNNLIADANGEVYNMEGSATDCEALYISDDILAHTNHYLSPLMRHFEADRSKTGDSIIRYHRAMRLLRENFGKLTPELFQDLLADHVDFPASLCSHGLETVTVFSIIIQPQKCRGWIGRGRPCETKFIEYQLEPGPGPGN
jgi:isopenicillin-N N-acyltransferase-like protein